MKVQEHLPEKLKEVFKPEQVVSFVVNDANEATKRNMLKECEAAIEAIATDMACSGVSKDCVDRIYKKVTKCVYNGRGQIKESVAERDETSRRSPRKQRRSPRKQRRVEANLVTLATAVVDAAAAAAAASATPAAAGNASADLHA